MLWKIKINFVRLVFLLVISVSCLIISWYILIRSISYYLEWELISLNSCRFEMTLIIDWMSCIFLGFVCFISSIVLYYRGSYIRGDININRFIYLVLAFVRSIAFLIIRPNIIRILLGWDGLGLVSYALVIYYQNEKSANAGILTALSNRVGDVAILLRISLIFELGGWRFYFYTESVEINNIVKLAGLVVLAAITKRAQIPFSAWLPAAIAAPTPVSALVHSSTLVTAGVYLLIRFRAALRGTIYETCLFLIGSITIFMAGLGANFETDLKKIIALSTLRQLGVIIRILAMGYPILAFFHLLAHALFKALLFICAGSIIHRAGDYQDIRIIGGLVNYMPVRVMSINLANLALCGTPFLAGFYSKDLILEVAFRENLNEVCFLLYTIATGLTVCYTFRLVYFRLRGAFNLRSLRRVRDEDVVITYPIIMLGGGAIVGGALLSWLIFPAPSIICLPLNYKLLALIVRVVGGVIGYIYNIIILNYQLNFLLHYNVIVFWGSIWFIPFLSTRGIRKIFLDLGNKYHKFCDIGWREYYGGQGVYKILRRWSGVVQIRQINNIKIYIIIFVIWLMMFRVLSI